MVVQSNTYLSTVPTDVKNIIASKLSIMDQYIIFATNENEYTALIYNPPTKNTVQYRIYREGQNYSYTWNIQRVNDVAFEYTITNEYYVVSNVGYGQMLDIPEIRCILLYKCFFFFLQLSVLCIRYS